MLHDLVTRGCACKGAVSCLVCMRGRSGKKRNLFEELKTQADRSFRASLAKARHASTVLSLVEAEAGEGVLVVHAGVVIAVNQARLEEVGLREEDLVGQPVHELSYLSSESKAWSRAMAKSGARTSTYKIIDRRGRARRLEEKRFDVELEDGPYTVLVGRDCGPATNSSRKPLTSFPYFADESA